jgi:hypothetical protein
MAHVYFWTASQVAPDFELDGTISEKRSDKYTVTKYPIESGANVTDHVEFSGRSWAIEGLIVAMPYADPTRIPGRLTNMRDALDTLAARKDACTMVTGFDTRRVVIASWGTIHDGGSGDSLKVSIEAEEISTAGFAYTQIPPGRLAPKQARRASPAAAKGGAAAPKPATQKGRSAFRGLLDRVRR